MTQSSRSRSRPSAAVFAPLDTVARAEVVEQRLVDAIASGLLGDGERLPSESELARRFNVATVTAREALERLRSVGLVETTRGRGGGSFVTAPHDIRRKILDERVKALSRVEIRDIGTHFGAITGTAAELAGSRATLDEIAGLRLLVDEAQRDSETSARRAEYSFRLEVVALSQSARLVREYLRLQADFGPVLWLVLRTEEGRSVAAAREHDLIAALSSRDGSGARRATVAQIDAAVDWLIDLKGALDGPAEARWSSEGRAEGPAEGRAEGRGEDW
jgi:DNA-binding FadR family transcriptional regulator